MDVNVSFIMLKDDATGDSAKEKCENEENVLGKSAVRTIVASTKSAYYPEKFTLKKTNVKVLAGQQKIDIAQIDFGKNATYITNDMWEAESDNDGIECFPNAGDKYDNKVYVNVAAYVPAGKYKVTVKSKVDMSIKATLTINVCESIRKIEFSGKPYGIKGKKTNFSIIAYNYEGKVIKNPKLRYIFLGSDNAPVDPKYVKIDGNGNITVSKDYYGGKICITAIADDYADNATTRSKNNVELYLIDKAVSIKGVKAYYGRDDYNFNEIKGPVCADYNVVRFKLYSDKSCKNEYLIYDGTKKDTEEPNASVVNYITLPPKSHEMMLGKYNYVITAVGGSSIKGVINYSYRSNSEEYRKLDFTNVISPEKVDDYNYKLNLSTYPTDMTVVAYLCKINNSMAHDSAGTAEGTVTVKNGTVKKVNGEYSFRFNKYPALITLTKKETEDGKTVTRKYCWEVINTNYEKAAAPKAKQMSKLYGNYAYGKDGAGEYVVPIVLTAPVEGCDYVTVDSQDPEIRDIGSNIEYTENYEGKPALLLKLDNDETWKFSTGTKKLTVNYKHRNTVLEKDNPFLTKDQTVVSLKFDKFDRSVSLKNSYTVSARDKSQAELLFAKPLGKSEIIEAELGNVNIKGKYNDFNKVFEVDCTNPKKPCFKLKNIGTEEVPQYVSSGTYAGYVKYTVKYEDGEKATNITKVTVKIVDTASKISSKCPNYSLTAGGTPYFNLIANKVNVDDILGVKLTPNVKDSVKITGVSVDETDPSKLLLQFEGGIENLTPGTYKTTVTVIRNSGAMVKPEGAPEDWKPSDSDYVNYGIKVPVTVKVVK